MSIIDFLSSRVNNKEDISTHRLPHCEACIQEFTMGNPIWAKLEPKWPTSSDSRGTKFILHQDIAMINLYTKLDIKA